MQLQQLQVKIGICSINNDPLDFKKNYQRIYESIEICKKMNCSMRIGGQLELPGYTCQDHFLQYDTTVHSWEMIKDLLLSGVTNGIVVQVGCPVLHKASLYNGTVIMYNSKVVAIRVKMHLADGGNYYQTRYFSHWQHPRQVGEFKLPLSVQYATGQHSVPIGSFILNFNDTSLAYEICQESWISNNPMIDAALDGAQIFINASASEIERGKIKRKIKALEQLTQRHGGAYAYVNIKGGLGTRNYFEGCCIFCQNGKLKQITEPYNLNNIQVKPFIINLSSIRNFRLCNKSFQKQSHGVSLIPRVNIDINIANNFQQYPYDKISHKNQLKRLRQLYQIPHATFEPSMYIWDVLRKSKARGFFLALSGGLDSFTVALIVYNMCYLLMQRMKKIDQKQQILNDIRRILRNNEYNPTNPHQLCNKILYTAYLATKNSSSSTRNRAKLISEVLGCKHRAINFDSIYQGFQEVSKKQLNFQVKYLKQGGSWRSDLAKQNIQARSRMVLTYYLASLELQIQKQQGFLLVLGSSNLDQSLRGYFTKYDCSSADLNPIGSFSKLRLKQFLTYFQQIHKFQMISQILTATPTAELRPLDKDQIVQTDEQDMGLTYAELSIFGHLRKIQRLGPVSMFDQMYCQHQYNNIDQLALKIKRFFTYYGINRHKATILPPSFHYDQEGCDDNRLDMRPYIYATDWSYQFEIIDQRVKYMKEQEVKNKVQQSAQISNNKEEVN